ncbi:hypothetical protein [Streptomyces sp. NBC_01296]|nr:hypothetical protein OG299_37830 [Streptomyces sp. NBC_01296]
MAADSIERLSPDGGGVGYPVEAEDAPVVLAWVMGEQMPERQRQGI